MKGQPWSEEDEILRVHWVRLELEGRWWVKSSMTSGHMPADREGIWLLQVFSSFWSLYSQGPLLDTSAFQAVPAVQSTRNDFCDLTRLISPWNVVLTHCPSDPLAQGTLFIWPYGLSVICLPRVNAVAYEELKVCLTAFICLYRSTVVCPSGSFVV